MDPHVHFSPVFMLATLLLSLAVFGTIHLLALTAEDSRPARAFIALGF